MSFRFEWDERKALANRSKHGITFEEAGTVFSDFLSITVPDPLHPAAEERYVTIGRSERQRLLVVVHTDHGDTVRLISARGATARERKTYEEAHG